MVLEINMKKNAEPLSLSIPEEVDMSASDIMETVE